MTDITDDIVVDRETPMPGVPVPGLLEADDRLREAIRRAREVLDPDPRPLLEQAGELSDALMRAQLQADPRAIDHRAALCRCRLRLHDAMIAYAAAEERAGYGRRA